MPLFRNIEEVKNILAELRIPFHGLQLQEGKGVVPRGRWY